MINLTDKKQFEELCVHALDKNYSSVKLTASGVGFLATLVARFVMESELELDSLDNIVGFISSKIKSAALEILNHKAEVH
jgi:hypothetical protein